MDNLRLGHLIVGDAKKDAIHVAIAPVIASERLAPGQHVGFVGTEIGVCKTPIGVVDPYLVAPVFKGDRFWLFLYPNTVTSLRHQWEHPSFDTKNEVKENAVAVLTATAKEAGLSYEALLDGAKGYLESSDYLCEGGRWEGFNFPDNFWENYEIAMDVKLPPDKYRGSFFSCSC